MLGTSKIVIFSVTANLKRQGKQFELGKHIICKVMSLLHFNLLTVQLLFLFIALLHTK
jgi:hypothetical protein